MTRSWLKHCGVFAIWCKCNIKFRYFRFWATLSRNGISVYLFFSFTVCNKNFDLTILIEHSPTFGKSEFGKLKAFARHLVDAFDITEGGTQVAVVSYGAKPIIHVLLNSFTGPQLRSRIIKETIDGIDFQKDEDSVSPSAALAKTLDTVFADGNGARNGTNKVIGLGKKTLLLSTLSL